MPVITFLTDFGTRDGFAASMKGVALSIAPDAVVVDATHDIAPGDIEAGAWVLSQYWRLFAPGTVHVAVVDPGVGGERKAIALEADSRCVVAPDNGLVTGVVREAEAWRCVELTEAQYTRSTVSPTFHGRDVFAPVAGHLAAGVTLDSLGPAVTAPRELRLPAPVREPVTVRGRIAHIDRFGNLISDIPADWIDEDWHFQVGRAKLAGLRKTYSDVAAGDLLAVVGSMGTVEIAARDRSAAKELGVARGDPIIARR